MHIRWSTVACVRMLGRVASFGRVLGNIAWYCGAWDDWKSTELRIGGGGRRGRTIFGERSSSTGGVESVNVDAPPSPGIVGPGPGHWMDGKPFTALPTCAGRLSWVEQVLELIDSEMVRRLLLCCHSHRTPDRLIHLTTVVALDCSH